ncbi:MAG: type IV pilus secretin PilQ [Pseudomonadales bacterium]|nr:type IV pilus secretin PilQ [Pseudomonadales bacterium]
MKLKRLQTTKVSTVVSALLTLALMCVASFSMAASVTLEKIDFASLSGNRVEMRLEFDGIPPDPRSYTIDQPARITLDLFDVVSGLKSKYHNLGVGNARSVTVLEAGDRTRVVVNLTEMVNYSTEVQGNTLFIMLGAGGTGFDQADEASVSKVASSESLDAVDLNRRTITNIDFRRGESGEGRVEISLSQPDVEIDISQQGTNVRVSMANAAIPENLQRRLDVVDFATPVHIVDALPEGDGSTVFIEAAGTYDYLAYQADDKLVLDFKPVTVDEAEKRRKAKFPYNGEKLSLNFQDIEVRSVLQLIADFTNLNLVASDTVDGRITLRLQNVPWDQALDLILKTKGLDKRQVGNVLMVAPADEIANRERLELENSRQVSELAPMQTEFIQVNYAKAADISELLSAEQGLLSSRGSVTVDSRTNTLLIQDTAAKLDAVRSALIYLDKPVRQVMIEARIVIASTDFERNLGIKWGGGTAYARGNTQFSAGGSQSTLGDLNPTGNAQTNQTTARTINFPGGLVVDMGVANPTTSFALGLLTDEGLLELELSALESDGLSEVVSQPKLVTADGQTARIESGVEIPYREASSSGAATISFKDAVLSLEVTPQITPDDRIIMDLKVNKDSVGQIFEGVPSVDTREIQTQVLVENGETIVLGGVYEIESVDATTKTPFLGDVPYLGRLFKRTEKKEEKTELLIFITPRLIKDSLNVR